MSYISRNENGAMIFTQNRLVRKGGWSYTRARREKKRECSGLYPHAFHGDRKNCRACLEFIKHPSLIDTCRATVGAFLEWVEFTFGGERG